MSLLDKAKVWLGIIDEEDLQGDADGRPALDDFSAAPQETLEDALVAREAGDIDEMRRLLAQMDRGKGLRTVLRAAAALEAEDEDLLAELLPKVRAEEPAWKLPLQLAAALEDDEPTSTRLREQAVTAGAPKWALAWSRVLAGDEADKRRGMVELLFLDAPLSRTVAARDLKLAGAVAEAQGTRRYVSFSHGRDAIRRFGASIVRDLLERT